MNDVIFAIALIGGIIYPLYAAIFAGQTKRKLMENMEWLSQTYRSILLTQWALVVPLLILIPFSDYSYNRMGLAFAVEQPLLILALIALAFISLWLLQQMKIPGKRLPSIREQMAASLYILPKNQREYRWSIALSFTAGICEEILFRGLLLIVISEYLPLLPSILLVNVFFALGHVGTGVKNMSFTFILGLSWSTIYFFTGSLWIPMLSHIIVDLYSMTTAYKVFSSGEMEPGIFSDTETSLE